MIAPNPRWIILSPHLDDAALSLGGLITALKSVTRVEVWSLFCGATFRGPYSELAEWLHSSSGGFSGSRLAWARKLEDRRACRHLGAAARHFGWKDAPYRKTGDGTFMYRTTQPGGWHPDEAGLISAITRRLARQIGESDVILSPLAVGKHVDHQLTRHVAEKLDVANLLYYPEVPYVQLFPEQYGEAARGLCKMPYALRRDEIAKWVGATAYYASQVGMLERAAGSIPDLIHGYAEDQLHLLRACANTPPDLTRYSVFSWRTG